MVLHVIVLLEVWVTLSQSSIGFVHLSKQNSDVSRNLQVVCILPKHEIFSFLLVDPDHDHVRLVFSITRRHHEVFTVVLSAIDAIGGIKLH